MQQQLDELTSQNTKLETKLQKAEKHQAMTAHDQSPSKQYTTELEQHIDTIEEEMAEVKEKQYQYEEQITQKELVIE